MIQAREIAYYLGERLGWNGRRHYWGAEDTVLSWSCFRVSTLDIDWAGVSQSQNRKNSRAEDIAPSSCYFRVDLLDIDWTGFSHSWKIEKVESRGNLVRIKEFGFKLRLFSEDDSSLCFIQLSNTSFERKKIVGNSDAILPLQNLIHNSLRRKVDNINDWSWVFTIWIFYIFHV